MAEEHKSGPNDRYFNRIQIFVCTARIPSALRVHVGCLNAKTRPPAPLNIHLQRQDSAAPLKFHTRALTTVPRAQIVRSGRHTNEVADPGTHPRSSGEPSRTLSESCVCLPEFAPEHSKNVVRKRGNLFYLVYVFRW